MYASALYPNMPIEPIDCQLTFQHTDKPYKTPLFKLHTKLVPLDPIPKGPSTQIVGIQGPKTIQSMDFGAKDPAIWVLGLSG